MVAGRDRRPHPGLSAALLALVVALPAGAQGDARDPALRAAIQAAVARSDSFVDAVDAEVWLTDFSGRLQPFVPDPERRLELLRLVHAEAQAAKVPPELVLAVIEVESRFDRFAISPAGALGLMQIMPFWIDEIGRSGDNLFHPRVNLRYGCAILRYYLDRERDDLMRALGRYNGRIDNNPYQGKVLDALNRRWFRR